MKVETPQLRWHQIVNPQCQKDAGANGPILSCSLHTAATASSSAIFVDNDGDIDESGRAPPVVGVLATAGNSEVNLWRVILTPDDARRSSSSSSSSSSPRILVQPQTKGLVADGGANNQPPPIAEHTIIEHVITLSRGTNDRGVNCVRFSPSGRHLVAACDGGVVVAYALPPPSSSNGVVNDHSSASANAVVCPSRWTNLEKETDLSTKVLYNQSDDVMDVAWSSDSRRFVTCSLDHTLSVWEYQSAAGGDDGGGGVGCDGGGNNWRTAHRSVRDHTHYIQGVAYDPRGVYLASMGSDRMVKVYTRREIREGTVMAELAKYRIYDAMDGEEEDRIRATERSRDDGEGRAAILEGKVLPGLLSSSAFVLQGKIKTLKFLNPDERPTTTTTTAANTTASTPSRLESCVMDDEGKDDAKGDSSSSSASSLKNNNVGVGGVPSSAKRHHMFADELTLGSFFRRLSFTVDGAFLVVPAALWHGSRKDDDGVGGEVGPGSPTSVLSGGADRLAESSFATYLFARHHFDQPYKVLTGLEKPSVVVRPNPLLFRLPPNVPEGKSALPYRSVFAVLTTDTVVIYDTHHDRPLSLARGLHYAGLTDAAWSGDGRTLFVTSSDGYVSILSFGVGELGDVYTAPMPRVIGKVIGASEETVVGESVDVPATASEDGSRQRPESKDGCINALVPNRKVEQTVPNGVTVNDPVNGSGKKKVRFGDPLDDRSNHPDPGHPVINNLVPKKKIKIASTHEETTQKSEVIENKRATEKLTTPIDESQGMSVNILVAKKKTKVAASLNPVPTIDENIE